MKFALFAAALALSGTVITPLSAQSGTAPLGKEKPGKIVVVLAHPDDELVIAPALHRLASAGNEITMIFATEGDQGPGVSGMERGAELGRVRTLEASCSTDALNIRTMDSLNLGDGTLGNGARKAGSSAHRLLDRLSGWMVGADTVITWGPEGGYGHSDHRMVGAVVTQFVQSLAKTTRPQLLYPALVNGPLPEPLEQQGWTLTAPDLASVSYSYNAADLSAATQAAQCHKTQFDDATRAQIVPVFNQLVWKGKVSFRPAF